MKDKSKEKEQKSVCEQIAVIQQMRKQSEFDIL